MCLEDRLLAALYQQQGPVPLTQLSLSISITPNAGLSIVKRIAASYPGYILTENGTAAEHLQLSANPKLAGEVAQFLAAGGFTAINEQEFLEYYQKELKREKWRAFINRLTSGQTWRRWLAGTGLTVAGGLGFLAWMKAQKK